MNKKNLIIAGAAIAALAVLAWVFVESSQPLPGVAELEPDRTHVAEGSPISYKYNPPTSGIHYPTWVSKGFYDVPFPDGNLVHSQEHGYVIFWYDCEAPAKTGFNLIPDAFAQTAVPMATAPTASPSATLQDLPQSFRNGSCDPLKNQIKASFSQNGGHKLIAVPRVGMGNPLTLTAWGRAEKLNSVDQGKIKQFIDAFRDRGPEQTNEP